MTMVRTEAIGDQFEKADLEGKKLWSVLFWA